MEQSLTEAIFIFEPRHNFTENKFGSCFAKVCEQIFAYDDDSDDDGDDDDAADINDEVVIIRSVLKAIA